MFCARFLFSIPQNHRHHVSKWMRPFQNFYRVCSGRRSSHMYMPFECASDASVEFSKFVANNSGRKI